MMHKNKFCFEVINAVIAREQFSACLGHSMMNQNKFCFEVINAVIASVLSSALFVPKNSQDLKSVIH